MAGHLDQKPLARRVLSGRIRAPWKELRPGGDDGQAGVREPRRPRPDRPSGVAERELPD